MPRFDKKLEKGDLVVVYNTGMDGNRFKEGDAKLLKKLNVPGIVVGAREFWSVRFHNGDVVDRWVLPEDYIGSTK